MGFSYYLLLETGFSNNTLQKLPSKAEINYMVPKDVPSQQAAMLIYFQVFTSSSLLMQNSP